MNSLKGQTVFTDTVCVETNKYNFFVESTELYYICVRENQIKDSTIIKLREVITLKDEVNRISELQLLGYEDEINLIRKQRNGVIWIWLGTIGLFCYLISVK